MTYEFLKVGDKPLRNPLQNQLAHIRASGTNLCKCIQTGSNRIKWIQIGYNGNKMNEQGTRLILQPLQKMTDVEI